MKVQSLYLENVRGLPRMQIEFVDSVSKQIRSRTVIAGSNGSGKTTILEAIGQLFGYINFQNLNWIEFESSIATLRIDGLTPDYTSTLAIEVHSDSSKHIGYINPDTGTIAPDQKIQANSGAIKIYGPAVNIREQIKEASNSLSGFPTCVYFPSESRQLQKKERGEVVAETRPYQWVYRFSDSKKWHGSLESFLVDMYFTDMQAWYKSVKEKNGNNNPSLRNGDFSKFVTLINKFLYGKQIQDVSEEKRVLIKTDNGLDLSFDQLSSGEKQIILLLGEIQRHIQHGSIVMIDEPEIHLHPRWQRMLMRALTDLCEEYDAQLIITTQSEEIANSVYGHELVLLDDVFETTASDAAETIQLS